MSKIETENRVKNTCTIEELTMREYNTKVIPSCLFPTGVNDPISSNCHIFHSASDSISLLSIKRLYSNR